MRCSWECCASILVDQLACPSNRFGHTHTKQNKEPSGVLSPGGHRKPQTTFLWLFNAAAFALSSRLPANKIGFPSRTKKPWLGERIKCYPSAGSSHSDMMICTLTSAFRVYFSSSSCVYTGSPLQKRSSPKVRGFPPENKEMRFGENILQVKLSLKLHLIFNDWASFAASK